MPRIEAVAGGDDGKEMASSDGSSFPEKMLDLNEENEISYDQNMMKKVGFLKNI